MTLEEEAERLRELLAGKTLTRVFRHRDWEIGFEFSDGTRFFADSVDQTALDLSVTGGSDSGD